MLNIVALLEQAGRDASVRHANHAALRRAMRTEVQGLSKIYCNNQVVMPPKMHCKNSVVMPPKKYCLVFVEMPPKKRRPARTGKAKVTLN